MPTRASLFKLMPGFQHVWSDTLFRVLTCVPSADRHLAQVNGFAARYESTGVDSSLAATSGFWSHLTSRHSYASGGSNDNEFWGAPMKLGDTFQKASWPLADVATDSLSPVYL